VPNEISLGGFCVVKLDPETEEKFVTHKLEANARRQKMKAQIRRASVEAMKGAFHEYKSPQETAWAMLINRNATRELVRFLLIELRLWGPRALVEARPEDLLDLLMHVPHDLNRDAILELLCDIPEKGESLRIMVEMEERMLENQARASGIEEGQAASPSMSMPMSMSERIARGRNSVFSFSGGTVSARPRLRLQALGSRRRTGNEIIDGDENSDSDSQNASQPLHAHQESVPEHTGTELFRDIFWNPFDYLNVPFWSEHETVASLEDSQGQGNDGNLVLPLPQTEENTPAATADQNVDPITL